MEPRRFINGESRPLPEPLARLPVHALDLHWAWNHAGDALWKRLDGALWERTQNPWLMLQYLTRERMDQLAADPAVLEALQSLETSREQYRSTPPWRPSAVTSLPLVAYFSMEFGLHEALPLYAGGLGVLAGDYLKTASDLDVPLIGVGILWQQGYFRQVVDVDGRQAEFYPFNDPVSLPVQPVLKEGGEHLRVALHFPGREILLRVWQATVGRSMLYLLDSNDPLNGPADRGLTSTLYGGGAEARLMQDIILGVGGWRLLASMGYDVDVCHLNEGHAAFVVIERARDFMERQRVTFREALWATRAGNIFTTHTAVPAGFDAFQAGQVERHRYYFDEYIQHLGVSWSDLLALGRCDPHDAQEPFSMAWLAMRGCSRVNGVSRLHGEVSRRLFAQLFPRWPVRDVPVGHITNGVHVPSWDSPWTDTLWTRAAGKARWLGDVSALTEALECMPDEDLWSVRACERHDLVRYARKRLELELARQGRPDVASRLVQGVLQPDTLTLGFARRFAGYKRPNLLLTDPDRLVRLLTRRDRPLQIIVAGKAHPEDDHGKRLVQQWVRFAMQPAVRSQVVFLDDYDMRLAVELVQGVDVWLNTPRRPWEACGTSGMKVLVNGGLNVSTLDGWWEEAYHPDGGWAIGDGLEGSEDDWDSRDAEHLYAQLEDEIIPEFYTRDASGLPRQWVARMRASMARLAPRFSSVRMMQEYVERAYVPAATSFRRRAAESGRLAKELNQWARHLEHHWSGIRFGEVKEVAQDGTLSLSALVHLGGISADAVRVQLYADPEGEEAPLVYEMDSVEPAPFETDAYLCRVVVETRRPSSHFTLRIVPHHPDADVPAELFLIAWQR